MIAFLFKDVWIGGTGWKKGGNSFLGANEFAYGRGVSRERVAPGRCCIKSQLT